MGKTLTWAAVVALALLGPLAVGSAGGTRLSDEQFVARAVANGLGEVKLSESAVKHATNKDVKEFAKKMVDEYTKANDKLLGFAREMKLAVVSGLDKTWKERLDQFTRYEGAKFDREYMDQQVKGHERALTLYEAEAKTGTNAALKRFAETAATTVRQHLKEAREIQAKLK
jgi:putative membrane protein